MSDVWQVTSDQPKAARARPSWPVSRVLCPVRAFTLIELLTVLAIMGILAALAVPALKNFGHSDAMIAATQQMLNAVGRARQLAISQRTTVYMVFVPTNFWDDSGFNPLRLTAAQRTDATNLCNEQLVGYTFVAYGAVGDQPGQHQWHYLDSWQTLPDGTFIAQQKFMSRAQYFTIPAYNPGIRMYGFETNAIPFPTEDSQQLVLLPCIEFNYLGQLTTNGVDMSLFHEYIPLARGVVAPAINPETRSFVLKPPQVTERPPGNSSNAYNLIDIDPLTGRARLEVPQVK